jgi:hypothetical protein
MAFGSGKLVRVVLRAVGPGTATVVNTLHYSLNDEALNPANDPQTLADRFRDDVMGPFGAMFTDDWSVQPVEVIQEKDPLNPTAPRSEWGSGVATPGTRSVSSDLLPVAICMVATLKTANIGRRARGRMFIGGSFVEGDQDAGVWNTFPLTAAQTLLDAIPRQPDLAEGANSSTAYWCVYSRTQRAQNLNPYAPSVTDAILKTDVHWLRSREH